ncbi:MAG: hypothetical protein JWN58_1963, partial [Gammaproteobacteria bacterium]|nr:hypothetical protein [Gammaproteobacteria bacterium]
LGLRVIDEGALSQEKRKTQRNVDKRRKGGKN